MKKVLLTGIAVLVIAATAGLAYWMFNSSVEVEREPFVVPPMGEQYTNETYGFSATLPQGFAAREMEGMVILENQTGEGIQIAITPTDEDIPSLSAERIQVDIPDMAVREPQIVEIGESRTGLAFKSDNEAFNGASREVWFVFRGNLYQISTYEYLDPLLQAIFQTWQFQ